MREPEDIKIGNYTLKEILERHLHWLNRDCEDWENMKADLSYANMNRADISGANLSYANLIGANLHNANLSYANMIGANLIGAKLSYANMIGANMIGASMIGADLSGTNLSIADLSCANIRDANLSSANLSGANIRDANLISARMSYANLRGANISDADRLRKGIKLSEPIIGWKKCKNNVLVKLEIPRGAIVFSINNNKCRTDKAKVLEIIGSDRAYSKQQFFSYYVGDIIEVFNFNCEYNVECAEGIHFFRTREQAEKY